MKKIINNKILCAVSILALFLSICTPSHAAYCNSPCPNPCSPSRTVCEGTNCTTYCDGSPYYGYGYYAGAYGPVYYNGRGSTRIVRTVSYLPVQNYKKRPPAAVHKAPPKPIHTVNQRPATNHKPTEHHGYAKPNGRH